MVCAASYVLLLQRPPAGLTRDRPNDHHDGHRRQGKRVESR